MTAVLRRCAAVGAAAVMVLAIGCNNDEPAVTPPAEEPTPPAEEPSPPPDEVVTVTAGMVDFDIELSETSFEPGTYTFVAEQQGATPHALAIEGPGVSDETGIIEPGGPSEELTVTLEPGTYELWCPVDNHREMGMEVTIEVAEGS